MKRVVTLGKVERGLGVPSEWPCFYPTATTLISCLGNHGEANILPVSSATIINRFPYLVGVGVARARYTSEYVRRYSHRLIEESGEFVANIPTDEILEAIKTCGGASGRNVNKFKLAGLTPGKPVWIDTPIIEECPINLECEVRQTITLGSHDFFIGEVMAIQMDEGYAFCTDGQEMFGGGDRVLYWRTVLSRKP